MTWYTKTTIEKIAEIQGVVFRKYQLRLIEQVLVDLGKEYYDRSLFEKQSSVRELVVSPVGSGKTLMSLSLAFAYLSLGLPVLYIVHRERLLHQTKLAARSMGLRSSCIAGGHKVDKNCLLQIASVQTLGGERNVEWMQKWFQPQLVIADEVHSTSFSEVLTKLFPDIPNDKKDVADYVGFTATPVRLSSRESLGQKFNSVAIAPQANDLMEQGYLVRGDYYSVPSNEENKVCNEEYIYNQWKKLTPGASTISFSSNVKDASSLGRYFQSQGVSSSVITGETSTSERDVIFNAFENGQIKLLASCDALREGFDVRNVTCLIVDRNTISKSLYFQCLGRGARPYPGKFKFTVIDTKGVVSRMGFLEELVITRDCLGFEYKKAFGSQPTKACSRCARYVSLSYRNCPHCDYEFPPADKPLLTKSLVKLWTSSEQRRYAYYQRLKAQGSKLLSTEKSANEWVVEKFWDKFGFYPPGEWFTNSEQKENKY